MQNLNALQVGLDKNVCQVHECQWNDYDVVAVGVPDECQTNRLFQCSERMQHSQEQELLAYTWWVYRPKTYEPMKKAQK